MLAEHERRFDLFGSHVRILIGAPLEPTALSPQAAAIAAEALLRRLHADLSRFDPASRLSALNRDPAQSVYAGPSVAMLVRAGIDAFRLSGGLVDALVVDSLEAAGYERSRVGIAAAPLREALAAAPPRRPATPAPVDVWARIAVDLASGEVTRPPGARIDSGGLAKGLGADLAGGRLAGYSSFAVDCGGDLRIGGASGMPRRVDVQHPMDEGEGLSFELADGAVATSGLRSRIWRLGGGYSHHLIDPGRGTPAWTGVAQATALAPTATRAEILAKAAVLSGPAGARRLLGRRGGVIVLDSGRVEHVGMPEPERVAPVTSPHPSPPSHPAPVAA